MQSKLKALQSALAALKEKETDTCEQVKKSLEIAEQAQYEKNAAELEIRRLKDELERQHLKLRDAISDQVQDNLSNKILIKSLIYCRVVESQMKDQQWNVAIPNKSNS